MPPPDCTEEQQEVTLAQSDLADAEDFLLLCQAAAFTASQADAQAQANLSQADQDVTSAEAVLSAAEDNLETCQNESLQGNQEAGARVRVRFDGRARMRALARWAAKQERRFAILRKRAESWTKE